MPIRRPRTIFRNLATAGVVALLVGLFGAPAIGAPAPTAAQIRFDTVSSPSVTLPDTPGAAELIYVVAGTPFEVTMTFLDSNGTPAPLSTNKSTTLTLSSGAGVMATTEVPALATSAALSGLSLPAAPDVELTASAPGPKKNTFVTGTSPVFDVLIESEGISSTGRTSTGGSGDTADGCVSTAANPVCADLLPPAGSGFAQGGLLSRGQCAAGACLDSYVQALVSFTANPADPATLVMKCDKDLCGVGAIRRQKLLVTLAPGSGDIEAPACATKGAVGPDQKFCVDYVQSTRDNAGDTFLYLLFVEDAKVRFP